MLFLTLRFPVTRAVYSKVVGYPQCSFANGFTAVDEVFVAEAATVVSEDCYATHGEVVLELGLCRNGETD